MLLEEWPTLVCPEEFPIVEASESKSPSRPLAAPLLLDRHLLRQCCFPSTQILLPLSHSG